MKRKKSIHQHLITGIFTILVGSCCLMSCDSKEKSDQLVKQAKDIYFFSNSDHKIKMDSSLKLINRAIRLNPDNLSAVDHKTLLLFLKRDSINLIPTVNRLIELDNRPARLGQKAMYLDLLNRDQEAEKHYNMSIDGYEEIINSSEPNFDLMIEYLGVLKMKEDTIKMNRVMTSMNNMPWADYQLQILEAYQEQTIAKEQLKRFWKGETGLEDLEN